jgi:hypothetical protein
MAMLAHMKFFFFLWTEKNLAMMKLHLAEMVEAVAPEGLIQDCALQISRLVSPSVSRCGQ